MALVHTQIAALKIIKDIKQISPGSNNHYIFGCFFLVAISAYLNKISFNPRLALPSVTRDNRKPFRWLNIVGKKKQNGAIFFLIQLMRKHIQLLKAEIENSVV